MEEKFSEIYEEFDRKRKQIQAHDEGLKELEEVSMPNIIEVNYQQTRQSTKINNLGMRDMQIRAYEVRNAQYLLLKAPPTSGKSRALMFLGLLTYRIGSNFQINLANGFPNLDLGFRVRQCMSGLDGFSLRDLVVASQRRGQYVFAKSDSVHQLYSYKSVLNRVVDGDTLFVTVYLGFGIWREQRLRLRGLRRDLLWGRINPPPKKRRLE